MHNPAEIRAVGCRTHVSPATYPGRVRLSQKSGDLDETLWFPCEHHAGARDLLYPSAGNTFRGRLPAWCETRQVSFRVSVSQLPDDLPEATRYWVRGFLAGQVPQLDVEEPEDMDLWGQRVDEFLTTGSWPQ